MKKSGVFRWLIPMSGYNLMQLLIKIRIKLIYLCFHTENSLFFSCYMVTNRGGNLQLSLMLG